MKRMLLWIAVVSTVYATDPAFLTANPFACRITQRKAQKPGKNQTSLSYVGYAQIENQQFAIIQLKNNQLILRKGESAGTVRIIRFTSDSLIYSENDTIFSIPIDPEQQNHNPVE